MDPDAKKPQRVTGAWVIASLAIVVGGFYLWLANDGRHHWHEFRYLYSAANLSTAELMQGAFDPGPAPMRPARQVAEWYATELLHIRLLSWLIQGFGDGLEAYARIKATFAGAMLLSAVFFYLALARAGVARTRAFLVTCLALANPVSLYLGFKLMGEVPGLLFGSAALALFSVSVCRSRPSAFFSFLAGLMLAAAALASAKMPLLLIGFAAALLAAPPKGVTRSRIAGAGLVSLLTCIALWAVGFRMLGGEPAIYFSAFHSFLSFSKDLPMLAFAVFNLMLAGGVFWLIAPLAALSPIRPRVRFFGCWTAVAALPVVLGGLNFLEPRYFAGAVVPFAGLCCLGLESIAQFLRRRLGSVASRAATLAIVAIAVSGSVFAQRFMPYETDDANLLAAVEPHLSDGETAVLLPWNYTDFHLLRFAFPDAPIYLVQSATDEKGNKTEDPAWVAARSAMYGAHYLAGPADLSRVREPKRIYVGWTILPSLQNLRDFFERLGLARFADRLDPANFLDHLEQSWLWQNPRFALEAIETRGQYQVYSVTATPEPAQVLQVPLWGLFEHSLVHPGSYANPFRDVRLETTFWSPSGKVYHFFGFYDGDGGGGSDGDIWKLRFMPQELGVWEWTAAFSDDSGTAQGSFECTKGTARGPLRIDATNPHWLRTADGKPFLPHWYYLHELLFSKEGQWQKDIDTLVTAAGYNMLCVLTTQAETLRSNGWNRRVFEEPIFYPWKRENGAVRWDRFDLASWNKLDRVLNYLRERGIYVYFFDGFFPNLAPRFPDDAGLENDYLRYALARIGAYSNLLHSVTFEFSEFMSTARLNRIGNAIEALDPFETLTTVHDTQEFDSIVVDQRWLDLANLQFDMGRVPDAATANAFVLKHANGKPVLGTEMVWEGGDKLTADEVRRGAWGIALAGASFLYGEFNINGTRLGEYGAGKAHPYLRILYEFFDEIPYWTLSPHNEVSNSGALCLADPGREYVLYTEKGAPIELDLGAFDGAFEVLWLNPRNGERRAAEPISGGGIRKFSNPEGDDRDWVLRLKSIGTETRQERH